MMKPRHRHQHHHGRNPRHLTARRQLSPFFLLITLIGSPSLSLHGIEAASVQSVAADSSLHSNRDNNNISHSAEQQKRSINNTYGREEQDERHGQSAETCRVAVCFSGHVRSLVYPIVHQSIRRNMIEALEASGDCQVDVFAYATLSDTVSKEVFLGESNNVVCIAIASFPRLYRSNAPPSS